MPWACENGHAKNTISAGLSYLQNARSVAPAQAEA